MSETEKEMDLQLEDALNMEIVRLRRIEQAAQHMPPVATQD